MKDLDTRLKCTICTNPGVTLANGYRLENFTIKCDHCREYVCDDEPCSYLTEEGAILCQRCKIGNARFVSEEGKCVMCGMEGEVTKEGEDMFCMECWLK